MDLIKKNGAKNPRSNLGKGEKISAARKKTFPLTVPISNVSFFGKQKKYSVPITFILIFQRKWNCSCLLEGSSRSNFDSGTNSTRLAHGLKLASICGSIYSLTQELIFSPLLLHYKYRVSENWSTDISLPGQLAIFSSTFQLRGCIPFVANIVKALPS